MFFSMVGHIRQWGSMSKPLWLSKEFDLILLCQQSHIKLLILLGTLVVEIENVIFKSGRDVIGIG